MDKEAPVKATAEYEAASAWKPTPTARKIISFVERHDGKTCSKAQIAVALGRNEKTIDRLIARMRHEGILEAERSGPRTAAGWQTPITWSTSSHELVWTGRRKRNLRSALFAASCGEPADSP